jgi:acyl-CoA thioester hydrolase
MASFRHDLRVRYHECDAQGHVFNANYFAFFDIAITELWRVALEGGYNAMVDRHDVDMVVAEAAARFLGSARFDEVISIDVELTRLGTTSTTTAFTVSREGERLVEGDLRHVFVDVTTMQKTEMPEVLRAALTPYLRGDGAAARVA